MKKLALWLGLFLLLPGAKAGTAAPSYYYNFGTVDSPQVAATVFANFGTFSAETSLPYTTQGTLFFTNSGTMSAFDGFQFDLETSLNSSLNSLPALSFFNNGAITAYSFQGTISASVGGPGSDLGFFSSVGENLEIFGSVSSAFPALAGYGSYLTINATNVVNSGSLVVDENGLLSITGQKVNLARSGLRSGAVPTSTTFFSGAGGTFGELAPMQVYSVDPEIVEIYQGGGTNQLFNGKGNALFPASLPFTGSFQVMSELYPQTAMMTEGGLGNAGNYKVFAWTNVIDATNFLVQVFYLNANNTAGDPNLTIDGGFVNNPAGNNRVGKVAIARFTLRQFDAVQQLEVTNSVFFADSIATITNGIALVNPEKGVRPSNWLFTWGQPGIYTGVSTGNVPYSINLLASTNYFGFVVTNVYSAYAAIATEQPGDAITEAARNGLTGANTTVGSINGNNVITVTGGNYVFGGGDFTDPTNFSGRVEISAGAMDPTDLRVRAVGELNITAGDITNNTGTKILPPLQLDAEWLSLNLGSVSKPLAMTNYVQPSVRRMDGVVQGWDATWTNYENQIIATLTNDPTTGVTSTNFATNVLTGTFFVTVMDQQFSTFKLANVLKFALHAKDADIQDNPPVEESLLLDVTNLTVSGGLVVAVQTNLDVTTCPKLQSLVVPTSGSISLVGGSIASIASFLGIGIVASGEVALGVGLPGQTNVTSVLTNFNNAGVTLNPISGLSGISADTIRVNSQVIINSGVLSAGTGLVSLQAGIGALDSGCSISAQGDVDLIGFNWKAQNSVIQAGSTAGGIVFPGALNLSVTNSLVGTGPAGQNNWSVYGGFNLLVKPQSGDLLGTTITSLLPQYAQSFHTWAATDMGATTSGYTNNAALGQLVLDGGVGSLFVFSGTGAKNAMYVTNLTLLDETTNYAAELQINPGMVIYFADAFVGAKEVTASGSALAALTNAFPGQLVYLPIPGVNGVALAAPPSNPSGTIKLLSGSSGSPVISWSAAANTGYQVQFTTNLMGSWQTIYSNTVGASQVVSLTNTPQAGAPQGFYRILVAH